MTRRYFGTDGIRGKVGEAPITPEFVMRLGYAAGKVLVQDQAGLDHPSVIIGKDTRISGYMLESALQAGLSAAGVDVLLVGPMPTPAIAYLTRALRASAGIVISASHNPYDDNGIKFFSSSGRKLPDAIELAIEAALDQPMHCQPSEKLGRARRISDAAGRYIEFCKSTFPSDSNLRGLRIVVDCANGATYQTAPLVFHELGADVINICNSPDGFNINAGCGSTHPAKLQQEVIAQQADLGIAFDGDGDRLIMCDRNGTLVDGDRLLYAIARHATLAGKPIGGIVGTAMTNLGLEHALGRLGLSLARAKVGDRYVMELLQEKGWLLGGETSGHIICLDKHSSGDGIIAALQVLEALQATGEDLGDYTRDLSLYPQVLINVPVVSRFDYQTSPAVASTLAAAEAALAGQGRILLRPSGTEPLIRVMVEGEEKTSVEHWAQELAQAVRQAAMP